MQIHNCLSYLLDQLKYFSGIIKDSKYITGLSRGERIQFFQPMEEEEIPTTNSSTLPSSFEK